jgi:hypothetical protein
MLNMYAKLFSRITQSSLMEQDIKTRYVFMMLLAIADSAGDVIGTDIAIARTLNIPREEFEQAIAALMSPDPESNSPEEDGRRVVSSDAGRGYRIVNYTKYREIKTTEEKREYMREYMRRRRNAFKGGDVTDVKLCKTQLSDVTQGEGEEYTEGKYESHARSLGGMSNDVNDGQQMSASSAHTDSSPKEKVPKRIKNASGELAMPFDDPDFIEAWGNWECHRKEKGARLTATTIKLQFKALEKMGVKRATSALIHSTTGGYTGIFEPKNQPFQPGKQSELRLKL